MTRLPVFTVFIQHINLALWEHWPARKYVSPRQNQNLCTTQSKLGTDD